MRGRQAADCHPAPSLAAIGFGRAAAGPTTAAGMATAKGWRASLTPAILVGTFGYANATFICLVLGKLVLIHMM